MYCNYRRSELFNERFYHFAFAAAREVLQAILIEIFNYKLSELVHQRQPVRCCTDLLAKSLRSCIAPVAIAISGYFTFLLLSKSFRGPRIGVFRLNAVSVKRQFAGYI